jgi:hypothetical protein
MIQNPFSRPLTGLSVRKMPSRTCLYREFFGIHPYQWGVIVSGKRFNGAAGVDDWESAQNINHNNPINPICMKQGLLDFIHSNLPATNKIKPD